MKKHDANLTIRRDFQRLSPELVAAAARLPTATLHEAGKKIGALPSAIKPVAPQFRCAGSALTVHSPVATTSGCTARWTSRRSAT